MSKTTIFIATIIGIVLIVALYQKNNQELPVYNASDFNAELVDNSVKKDAKHFVSDFELTNQNGKIITQEDYKNKIYVTDFFFTRCPSICPVMTDNMQKLQEEFLDNPDIMLLSISVTPKLDSVPILKEYAEKHNALSSKWNITTGDKKHIYNLARKSYFAAVNQGDGGLQDFIHTPNFVLVDDKKQIRGVYNGTDPKEISQLISDIKVLL